jgi:hypothetical protein
MLAKETSDFLGFFKKLYDRVTGKPGALGQKTEETDSKKSATLYTEYAPQHFQALSPKEPLAAKSEMTTLLEDAEIEVKEITKATSKVLSTERVNVPLDDKENLNTAMIEAMTQIKKIEELIGGYKTKVKQLTSENKKLDENPTFNSDKQIERNLMRIDMYKQQIKEYEKSKDGLNEMLHKELTVSEAINRGPT